MAEITIRRRRPKADACVLRENSGPHAWVPNMVPSLSAHSAIIFCAISNPKICFNIPMWSQSTALSTLIG